MRVRKPQERILAYFLHIIMRKTGKKPNMYSAIKIRDAMKGTLK